MINEFRKQFYESCISFSRSRRSSKEQRCFPTIVLVSCTVLQLGQRRKVSETVFGTKEIETGKTTMLSKSVFVLLHPYPLLSS